MNEKESALLSGGTDRQGSNVVNAFNLHRVLREVKPGSIWSKIYYDPLLTGGYRAKNSLGQDSETLFNFDPNAFLLREFENISIDKIVILFGAPQIGKDGTRKFWKEFDLMIDWGHPEITGGGPLYRNSVKWCEDFFIQWECEQNKLETIRLEFNPNKTDLRPLAAFFSVLKPHSLEYARVTRLDVAVDYAIYLNPLCWMIRNTPYSARFEYNSRLKTRYFGAPSSDVQIRIYDKAQELQDHGAGELDIKDFWRVEAQVKAIKGNSFDLMDSAAVAGFNPFDRLEFYDPYGFEYEGQGMFSLFVAAAVTRGISYAASELHKDTRRAYLERLRENMGKQSFNLPSVIYREVFGDVYRRFTDRMQELFDLGQAKGKLIFKEV